MFFYIITNKFNICLIRKCKIINLDFINFFCIIICSCRCRRLGNDMISWPTFVYIVVILDSINLRYLQLISYISKYRLRGKKPTHALYHRLSGINPH